MNETHYVPPVMRKHIWMSGGKDIFADLHVVWVTYWFKNLFSFSFKHCNIKTKALTAFLDIKLPTYETVPRPTFHLFSFTS